MSLMTYTDAFPWGESLRVELIAGHMPPWHAQEGVVRFKNAPTITAAESDKILTWASGGNPEGNPQSVLPPVSVRRDWPLGKPDLVLPLSPEVIVPAETSETTQEFTLATQTTEAKWVRAVDLVPGTPAIVRDAIISVKPSTTADAATDTAPDRVLAVWVPGEDPVAAADGAFRLPAGAELIVRVHYKKTYQYEQADDRSQYGRVVASPRARRKRFDVSMRHPQASRRRARSLCHSVGQSVRISGRWRSARIGRSRIYSSR